MTWVPRLAQRLATLVCEMQAEWMCFGGASLSVALKLRKRGTRHRTTPEGIRDAKWVLLLDRTRWIGKQAAALERVGRNLRFATNDLLVTGQLLDRVPFLSVFAAKGRDGSPIKAFQGGTNPRYPGDTEQERCHGKDGRC